MIRNLFLLAVVVTPTVYVPAQAPARRAVTSEHGMVVCVSPPAAEIGVAVLKKGGTAVDAAVAVGFAQAVSWPSAGNLGGGGFMLVHPGADQQPAFFDYREKAPAAATVDMFAKKLDYQSHLVSGVPGTVRGLALAHQTFGKLPWKDLVMPAVDLAKKGVPVNAALARSLNSGLAKYKNQEFHRVYGKPKGAKWQAGDTLTLPDLANTLTLIAEQGPNAFYTGAVAEKIAAEMKLGGGLITKDDLAAYTAKKRTPIRSTYRGFGILSAPPPSSGGITVSLMLNILENFDLAKHPRHSPETTHLIAEAMRRGYAERARYLGDPDFNTIPDKLLSKEFAKKLAAGIDPKKATRSETLAGDIPLSPESEQTTHFSIVDANGMAVSNTYTLEHSFGSGVVVRGAGFLLNNEMTDFNHRPGVTDRTGRIGTKPNLVAPGKRMLSSMTPTMVLKDGKVVLVTGSPGGRTIINTVLCIVINFIDYNMNVQDAVDAPRMHHQWFPDRIQQEHFKGDEALIEALKKMGHTVTFSRQGDGHSIAIDPKTGMKTGAADRRIDGKAAGY